MNENKTPAQASPAPDAGKTASPEKGQTPAQNLLKAVAGGKIVVKGFKVTGIKGAYLDLEDKKGKKSSMNYLTFLGKYMAELKQKGVI